MTRGKLVIQKSDLISLMMREESKLPAADRRHFREILLEDQLELVMAESPDRLKKEIADATILFTENRAVTAELLSNARELKLIQNGCLRHFAIDLDAARRAGIPVAAIASPLDVSVAEHALMLMMALGKRLLTTDQAVRRGEGRRIVAPHVTSETQSSLYRKTLGIVGLGEIGCLVARRATAFGMRVLYYNHRRYPAAEERDMGLEYRPLPELMAEADFVDIHIALTPTTTGLIGRRELAAMKPGAFLVNTARGAIVDQQALTDALKEGRLGGAGLDVFVDEPLPEGHPLTLLDNVILTPHVAGSGVTWESLHELFLNVHHVLRGEPLEGVIN